MKMFKRAVMALALVTCPAPALAQANFTPTERERSVATIVQEIALRQIQMAQGDTSIDVSAMEQRLRGVVASPDYRASRPLVQDLVLRLLSSTLMNDFRANCAELVSLTDGLTARADSQPVLDRADFSLQFVVGSVCDQHRAARALVVLTARYSELIAELEDETILRAARHLDDAATLEFLVDGRWRPTDEDTDVALLRLHLARLYLQASNVDRASEVAQSLVVAPGASVSTIVRLLVEKDFRSIIERDPETFEFGAIMAWQLSSVEARATSGPNVLRLQNAHARLLFFLDRKEEALTLVDAALARVTAAGETPAFTDQDDELNWTHDLRASILLAMQSDEEALAALQRGVDVANASGGDLVSQLLNRSADLVSLGRSAEALEALAGYDPANASPYGQMVALRIRACALHQTGDVAGARAVVADMRERAADSLLQAQAAAV